MPAKDQGCTSCGMAECGDEFHPHALCLLVRARGGDTLAARQDMASIIAAARSDDSWLRPRVENFLRRVRRDA